MKYVSLISVVAMLANNKYNLESNTYNPMVGILTTKLKSYGETTLKELREYIQNSRTAGKELMIKTLDEILTNLKSESDQPIKSTTEAPTDSSNDNEYHGIVSALQDIIGTVTPLKVFKIDGWTGDITEIDPNKSTEWYGVDTSSSEDSTSYTDQSLCSAIETAKVELANRKKDAESIQDDLNNWPDGFAPALKEDHEKTVKAHYDKISKLEHFLATHKCSSIEPTIDDKTRKEIRKKIDRLSVSVNDNLPEKIANANDMIKHHKAEIQSQRMTLSSLEQELKYKSGRIEELRKQLGDIK